MRSEIVPLLACEKRKMQPSPGEDVMVGALRVSRAEFTNKGRYARDVSFIVQKICSIGRALRGCVIYLDGALQSRIVL